MDQIFCLWLHMIMYCLLCNQRLLSHASTVSCEICHGKCHTRCISLDNHELSTIMSTENSWYCVSCISSMLPYGSGEMYWMTFPWPWPKVTDVTLINKNFFCLCNKLRTTHRIMTKRDSFIALVMVITWLDFGAFLLETFVLANFL